MKRFIVIFAINLLFQASYGQKLYEYENKDSRVSSFENLHGTTGQGGQSNKGAKGNAFESIKKGTTKVLLDVKGAGEIQRIWMTLNDRSPQMLRSLRLQMFWDGDAKPAVDVPLGDFFGVGLGLTTKFESALFTSPEGRSFNCYIPMPYKKGAKVQIVNESDKDLHMFYYDIDYVISESMPNNALYFHTFWTRQKTSELGQDFVFLPKLNGKGRYLGVNMGVNADQNMKESWWGEGEVKIYKDGDKQFPTINGTGAEDYIGTGWGLGTYSNSFQGCTVANDSLSQYAFYRYHIPDQIYFKTDISCSIQQIGGCNRDIYRELIKKQVQTKPISVHLDGNFRRLLDDPLDVMNNAFPNGWVNFYRIDDYSATTYFYLDKTSSNLEPLKTVSERL